MIYCTCSAYVTVIAWCKFIQPVRHVYSLVQANATPNPYRSIARVDTASIT